MSYVTVYTSKVKGKILGCAYRTKSLTPMHENIRKACPDAVTYKDPKYVITDFVPGVNTGMLPIVRGGCVVARAIRDRMIAQRAGEAA